MRQMSVISGHPIFTGFCKFTGYQRDPQDLGRHIATPSPILMHILSTLAARSTPETPTAKAIPYALPVQNFRKFVAFVQTFATTSHTFVAAHIAWHNGWLITKPSWFRFGAAPGPQQLHQLHQFYQPPKA